MVRTEDGTSGLDGMVAWPWDAAWGMEEEGVRRWEADGVGGVGVWRLLALGVAGIGGRVGDGRRHGLEDSGHAWRDDDNGPGDRAVRSSSTCMEAREMADYGGSGSGIESPKMKGKMVEGIGTGSTGSGDTMVMGGDGEGRRLAWSFGGGRTLRVGMSGVETGAGDLRRMEEAASG